MTTISGSPVFCSRWDSLGNFEVIDIPEGQPIILSGAFKDVLVQVPDINLELAPGTTVMRLIAGIDDTQKSAAGADSTKTKLTFTYGTDFGGILEYTIVADGVASSTGTWADVPATGVQTGDLAATATGDLYVRIKAEAGVSNASAPVKALDVLAVGMTTPGSSSAELIISGQSSTTLDYVVVMDDLGSFGETGELNDPILLEVSINTPQVTGVPFNPITDNASSVTVSVNDGTSTPDDNSFQGLYGSNVQFLGNHYLWVKVVSENLSTTKYYKIFVQF